MQRSSLSAGRSYLPTFTARRAPSSGDLHWMQSSPLTRPSRPSRGAGVIGWRPALCAELDLYSDLHSVHGFAIWRPSLCADLTWGSARRYVKAARRSPRKLGSFCNTCVAVVTARRGCFAVLIGRLWQSRLGSVIESPSRGADPRTARLRVRYPSAVIKYVSSKRTPPTPSCQTAGSRLRIFLQWQIELWKSSGYIKGFRSDADAVAGVRIASLGQLARLALSTPPRVQTLESPAS
jgi:hypothetical protein